MLYVNIVTPGFCRPKDKVAVKVGLTAKICCPFFIIATEGLDENNIGDQGWYVSNMNTGSNRVHMNSCYPSG